MQLRQTASSAVWLSPCVCQWGVSNAMFTTVPLSAWVEASSPPSGTDFLPFIARHVPHDITGAIGHSQLCFNGQSKLWFISSCAPELTCSFPLYESSVRLVWMLGEHWLRPTRQLMWTQYPAGILSTAYLWSACKIPCKNPGWWEGRSKATLWLHSLSPRLGEISPWLHNVFRRQSEECFQEFCFFYNCQLAFKFPPHSKAVVTLLGPIFQVNASWVITVAGRAFSVIFLSLRSMTTLGQHVSQARHPAVIPEIRSKLLFESYHLWLLKTSTSVHLIPK